MVGLITNRGRRNPLSRRRCRRPVQRPRPISSSKRQPVDEDPPPGCCYVGQGNRCRLTLDSVSMRIYKEQIEESQGFDVGDFPCYPAGGIYPCPDGNYDPILIALCSNLGLHCFNFLNGKNITLLGHDKLNALNNYIEEYFITLNAQDPLVPSQPPVPFQVQVTVNSIPERNAHLLIYTAICRLKPEIIIDSKDAYSRWDFSKIDKVYRANLPRVFPDSVLAGHDGEQPYYEVLQSDLLEHKWLIEYAEFAFYSKWTSKGLEREFENSNLKIMRAVAWAKDWPLQPQWIFKSLNVVFYMLFEANTDANGSRNMFKGIIRRTMDGNPGHISLELQCFEV